MDTEHKMKSVEWDRPISNICSDVADSLDAVGVSCEQIRTVLVVNLGVLSCGGQLG